MNLMAIEDEKLDDVVPLVSQCYKLIIMISGAGGTVNLNYQVCSRRNGFDESIWFLITCTMIHT